MTTESLTEAFAGSGPGYEWTPGWLRRARAEQERYLAMLVAATLVGLGLAWLHWLGLVAGGALLGLSSRSVREAVARGFAFDVLVLVVNVLAAPVMGPVEFLALTPISVVSIATAVLAPLWGSLVRGIV